MARSFLRHAALGSTVLKPVIYGTSLGLGIFLGLNGAALAADEGPQLAQAAPATSGGKDANSKEGGFIEDITVTARQRKEKLEDIPLAISVLSGDDISDKGIQSIRNIQFEVPSTGIFLSNPRQTQSAIRGLGANPASNGLASSVGYYLDGVYLDRPGMAAIDFFDMQQIEVLRGPQGTLFGKNNTAGALSLQTAKVKLAEEYKLETTWGNYGTQEYKGVVNSRLFGSDVLAVRLSALSNVHDGYLTAPNALPGTDWNDQNRQSVRLQFLYQPSDKFDLTIRSDYSIQHDSYGASVVYANAGDWSGSRNGIVSWNSTANAAVARNTAIDPNSYVTSGNGTQNMMTRNYGGGIEANWHFDGYTLTSITGVRSYFFRPYNYGITTWNTSGSGGANYYSSQARERELEATQEVRLASPVAADIPIDYVVGAYAFWRRENTSSQVNYPSNWSSLAGNGATTAFLNGAFTKTDSDPNTQAVSLFGQANWHVDDRFTITGGLRETFEKNQMDLIRYAPQGPNVTAANGYNATQSGYWYGQLAQYNLNLSELASFAYKVDKNILTYLTFSHGAKANGFNTQAPSCNTSVCQSKDTLLVYPEKNYTTELGLKQSYPDIGLTVNADVFFSRVFDYQSNSIVYYTNGTKSSLIVNAGAVNTQGLEWDANWKINSNLRVGFNGAYNLAMYSSYRGAGSELGNPNATQDLSNRPVLSAPKWSGIVNATYTYPVTDDLAAYVAGSYSYKGNQYGNVDDSPSSIIKAYGIANFRVGANIGDNYDVAVYIDNAFDEAWFYSVSALSTKVGAYSAAAGTPRTFGLNLRAKW